MPADPEATPAAPPPTSSHAPRRPLVYLVISSVLFGVMAVVAKRAAVRLPGAQVAFLRFSIGVVAVLVAWLGGLRIKPVSYRWLLVRGGFGSLAVLLFFTAIEKLPVGTATLLTYTAPVFTVVFAALFLDEKMTLGAVAALALTFFGVVLVVRGNAPPAPLSGIGPGMSPVQSAWGFGVWQACGLTSALMSGAAVTTIRHARKFDGAWEIFGAFCLVGMLATAPFALPRWRSPTGHEWALLLAVGLIAVVGQVLFTIALRDVTAAVYGVLSQLAPVTALVLGALVLGDALRPLAALGSVITLGGVAWSIAAASRATRSSTVRQPSA